MRWDEPTFWATSVRYYYRARAGWDRANGRAPAATKPMTRSRFDEMLDLDRAGLLGKYATKAELEKA